MLHEIIDEALRKRKREGKQQGKREGGREATESAIVAVLVARFGTQGEALKAQLTAISDDQLKKLVEFAATCPDLGAFQQELAPRRSR